MVRSTRQLESSVASSVFASAAAAGAFACLGAGQTKAAVVYTPANLIVNSSTTSQSIDLDHDGTSDLEVEYGQPFQVPISPFPIFGTETNLKVVSNGAANFATDGSLNNDGADNAVAFSAGNLIGATLPAGDTYVTADGEEGGNLQTPAQTDINSISQPADGHFPASAGEKYIGIQFTAAGNLSTTPNYGYVAYETTNDSSTASLAGEVLGYAYETQPGVAITAGAVPEPSSLALLAMGALGLARYRGMRCRRAGNW